MKDSCIVITGASGEIGHALIKYFAEHKGNYIVAVDLKGLEPELAQHCHEVIISDILDPALLKRLEMFNITEIYHLAALLSTRSEQIPEKAHVVNVEGTLNLLQVAQTIGKREGRAVKFLFPSSIAVYGIPTLAKKAEAGKVNEDECLLPVTMYGINKLYCEHLGRYYSDHYKRLSDEKESGFVDFRGLRFPGLISAFTIPTGGTSDYAPEMIHAAAQGKHYNCFVRPDAQIPFMAMPDAISAIIKLMSAPQENLSRRVYNIGAFAPTAEEIATLISASFPASTVSYQPHPKRQEIVDSWCADVDDSAARADWHWSPEFDYERAFAEYLIPNIVNYYKEKLG